MSTTSAYGWNIPDNTDLVKDGALAIRTLGNAIDTSMNTALGTKKAGMVLLNTTSFSGVSSQSLSTNIFTSTYQNYLLFMNWTASSTHAINFRFRKAGVDVSSAYFFAGISTIHSSATISSQRGSNVTSVYSSTGVGTGDASALLLITDAALAKEPKIEVTLTPSTGLYEKFGGVASGTTAIDSLTFYPSTGTITGSISVYGVNK